MYSIIGGVTGMVMQLLWGRAIDRFGSRPVTVLNFALVGVMPLLWLFATPSFRLPIWGDALLNGLDWSGAHFSVRQMDGAKVTRVGLSLPQPG